ncbi:MAG: Cna B-type domain-containing protein [Oscillospiraceae bacterium]
MTKKRFEMRVISFIISLAVLNMLILISPFAYAYEHGKTELNADTLIAENKLIVSADVKLNGAAITADPADIRSGDNLTFSLNWSVDPEDTTDYNDKVIIYDMSDKLPNIKLTEQTSTVDMGGVTVGKYTVSGNILYIEILTGGGVTDRSGSFSFNGTLDLNGINTDDQGKFSISFFDKSLIFRAPENLPNTQIEKSASGSVYSAGGKYYQDFTLKLYNNGRVDAENVSVTDTAGDLYVSGGISNVKYNGADFTDYTVSGSDTIFNIGSLAANGNNYDRYSTLTYTMELDSAKLFSNTGDSKNSAFAKPETQPATYTVNAWANYSLPSLNKSGEYDAAGKKITWTITVYPNIFADSENEDSFVIKDVPDSQLLVGGYTAADIASAISGATVNGSTITIPSSAFSKQSDGTYTLTYTTNVDDSIPQEYTSVNIKNKAVLCYDGISYSDSKEPIVTIHSTASIDYINKTFERIEGSALYWKQTIYVPENAAKISVSDGLSELSEYSADVVSNDYDSLTITDGNGVSYGLTSTENDGKIYHYGDIGVIDLTWQYNPFANYTLTIDNAGFLAANEGKYITVSYKTDLPGEIPDKCRNTANVYIEFTDSTSLNDNAQDEYIKPVTVTKYEDGFWHWSGINTADMRYPKAWAITLQNNSYTFTDGEVITITEHIPDGFEYVGGTAKIELDGNSSDELQAQLSVSGADDLNIAISVTADMAAKLNDGKAFKLFLITEMTNDCYVGFCKGSDPVTMNITNKADMEIGSANYSASCTVSITSDPGRIINKTVAAQSINSSGTGFTASYKIEVNSARADLVPGDTITLYDTLGSTLLLKDGTVVIEKITVQPNGWGGYDTVREAVSSSVMTKDGQTLMFTLADNTYYEITYDIESKPGSILYENEFDPESPDAATLEAIEKELNKRYGNTVRIEAQGEDLSSRNVMLNTSTFKVDASIEFSITINGTKTWNSNGYSFETGSRPDNITVVITQHKDYIEGLGEDTSIDMTYHLVTDDDDLLPNDPDSNIYYIKPTISGSDWTFSITGLTIKDRIGTIFSYYIKEVSVNGYTTSYQYKDGSTWREFNNSEFAIGSTTSSEIKIVNSFEGVTSVSGTKTWLDGGNSLGLRPDTVSLKLLRNGEEYAAEPVWTDTNTNVWTYTYSGLPECAPDGTLYAYTVEETDVDPNYSATYDVSGLNITNRFNMSQTTELTGTKTWIGGKEASLTLILKCDGNTVSSPVIEWRDTNTDYWKFIIKNLTKYYTKPDGTIAEHIYTVDEVCPEGYTSSRLGNNFVNTKNTPETTTTSETTPTTPETTPTTPVTTPTTPVTTPTTPETTPTTPVTTTTVPETTTTAPVTTTTNHNTGGIVLPIFSSAETTAAADDISAEAAISAATEQDSFGERMSAAFIIVAVIDAISAVALTVIIRRRKKNEK